MDQLCIILVCRKKSYKKKLLEYSVVSNTTDKEAINNEQHSCTLSK